MGILLRLAVPLSFAGSLALSACSSAHDPGADATSSVGALGASELTADEARIADDPMALPLPILTYEWNSGLGSHHFRWHVTRKWDTSDPALVGYMKSQGWEPARVQEGDLGYGLDFLAMHRAMLEQMRAQFPDDASLFEGWVDIPTDPRDAENPVHPKKIARFDPNMLRAIDRITNHPETFQTDDEFGRYISVDLGARHPDTGLHGYLHDRWSVASSAVDLNNLHVAPMNRRFWRLHGWIDTQWTRFRQAHGFSDTNPDYARAMDNARRELQTM